MTRLYIQVGILAGSYFTIMTEQIVEVIAGKPSFRSRDLTAIITLPTDVFVDNSNSVTISGAKIRADINIPGMESMPYARIEIYGLDKSITDKITTYSWNINKYTNSSIQLFTGETLIFYGVFINAFSDYEDMPNVPFVIDAYYQLGAMLSPVPGLSFSGPVPIVTLAKSIANLMGRDAVENNLRSENKNRTLTDAAFSGTPLAMLWKLQKDANIDIIMESETISLCEKDSWRTDEFKSMPLVSSETGLVGVPVRETAVQWRLTVLYHPSYRSRGLINLRSKLIPGAENINIMIISMRHILESQTPGGAWFTEIVGWTQPDG